MRYHSKAALLPAILVLPHSYVIPILSIPFVRWPFFSLGDRWVLSKLPNFFALLYLIRFVLYFF